MRGSRAATRLSWLLCCGILLAAGSLAVEVNDSGLGAASEPVDVLRCCRAGEELEKPPQHGEAEMRCVNRTDSLRPLIYSPQTQKLLEDFPPSWRLHDARRPQCGPEHALRYIAHSKYNPFVLFENGMVALESGNGEVLQPDQYCLSARSLFACLPRKREGQQAAATMVPKLRKCCGENAAYLGNSCLGIEPESSASEQDEERKLLGPNVNVTVEIVSGFPVCPRLDNFTIVGDVADATLRPDASLLVDGQLIPTEEFCIERVRIAGSERLAAKVFACSEHAAKGSGLPARDIRFTLYPVGFIISAIFLAATLAAGWLLPASHHVLHWRCQTHHVACLMLGDISMAVIQLAGNSLQGELCRAIAILAHFFFLATFFWLNTMCFNIWWTFRDLRPASLEKGQELLRLRFYAAYAWGGPLIVAGLAAFLDHLPQTPGQTYLRPRFGEKQCWFYGDMEILTYFFGPIGVLLAINLLFFAATARELTCGLWKGEFVKSTTERAALGKVCLKLVIVMGVPWIFDVISWMAGGPAFLWYLTDLLNAAQGVLIFIVVGCQPQVRAAVKRLWSRNPRANANRQGNGLSTTSHGMPSMGDSVTQNPSTKTAPLETIC